MLCVWSELPMGYKPQIHGLLPRLGIHDRPFLVAGQGQATKLRFSWNNQKHKDGIFSFLLQVRIVQIGKDLQEFLGMPFSHSFCYGVSSSALRLWPNLICFLGYISLVIFPWSSSITWVGTHQKYLFNIFFVCL